MTSVRLAAAALALTAAACGPFRGPAATAPFCDPADGVNVYVRQGTQAACQLRIGQRYVVEMPRAQGSDDALRTICLTIWRGAAFIVNFGDLDYCPLATRHA